MSNAVSVVDRDTLFAAVEAAIRAPSMHNAQPWRFRLFADGMAVYPDPSRRLPVADPTGWAVRIAAGAAAANARLALIAAGYTTRLVLTPTEPEPVPLARLTVVERRPPTPADLALAAAIRARRSNRLPFDDAPVPPAARLAIVLQARQQGAWLELMTGRGPVAVVAEIIRAADTVLRRRPGYAEELASWIRPGQDPASVDGVPRDTGGIVPPGQGLLAMRDFDAPERKGGRDYESEPLVGVLGTIGDTDYDQVRAGVALQHVLLAATEARLAVSLLSQPIEVPAAREQLAAGLGNRGIPQMVLRIGYGQPVPDSPRRPAEAVIDN
jgi:hypothetical protein